MVFEKKGVSKHQSQMLKQEIAKNKHIYEVNKNLKPDTTQNTLNLADQNLKDLAFLPKMI